MSHLLVNVYTNGPNCMACTQTKRHLTRRGIPFTEIPIHEDGCTLAAITELGFTAAPVVCVATPQGEQSWCGYRPDRIDALLTALP
jgi:glutaredoxin-like protein NrdH